MVGVIKERRETMGKNKHRIVIVGFGGMGNWHRELTSQRPGSRFLPDPLKAKIAPPAAGLGFSSVISMFFSIHNRLIFQVSGPQVPDGLHKKTCFTVINQIN